MSEELLPFSVVIPAYNAKPFIERALESVAAQTFKAYEIVVVDDGSSDGTSSRTEAWTRSHPEIRLRLVRQQNRGIGGSRNTGVREAVGQYVAFLDQDDVWTKDKLAGVFRVLTASSAPIDLVCHDEWLEENGRTTARQTYGPYTGYEDLLFKGNCLSASATVVRRQALLEVGGFREDRKLNGVEDYDLWLRLARAGCRFEYLHEPLGIYCVHGMGYTSNVELNCEHSLNVLASHFAQWSAPTPYYRYLMRKRRGDAFRVAGRLLMKRGEHLKAREFFRKALHEDPFSWKAWGFTFLTLARITV